MEACALVRTEHLNHYGRLFGGQMLRWVDEFAWVAATRQFPGRNFVTRALQQVEFRHQVGNGEILTFEIELESQGVSSVAYAVRVSAQSPATAKQRQVFTTTVVMVAVDTNGNKTQI